MKKICVSCGKDLGTIKDGGSAEVSHGLCDACSVHFLADVGISLGEFIEGIDAPIVTITQTGVVGSANAAARKILKKNSRQITGNLGGVVFECEYAMLPEGCGQTVHCSGCVIRQTVMHTLNTGEPHTRVPAYLNHHEPDGPRNISMCISTEKKGGIVFLRVEEMDTITF